MGSASTHPAWYATALVALVVGRPGRADAAHAEGTGWEAFAPDARMCRGSGDL
jgi:hypothetical protein